MGDGAWETCSYVLLLWGAAVLVRLCVGLHPYSGQGLAPRFGDYEAQRHWMELTINLPIQEWYVQSEANDLQYWGLDYPPLTAFQSWLCGKVLAAVCPEFMELGSSRGFESPFTKLLMRWSVVVWDLLVYLPAVTAFVMCYYSRHPLLSRLWALSVCVLQPPLLLIDHGHFQYNSISLGLAAAAALAVVSDHDVLGSVLYCLSLNHKQMAMYYAPAFFAYLLGKCLRRATALGKVAAVARLGTAVVATFALVWSPWLLSPDGPSAALPVLQRLAPVSRGLYEDYVSNFWCATNPIGRWRQLFEMQQLLRMCACATAVAMLPSVAQQVARPSRRGFLLAMLNCSMAFYLFSFMVHEKSILLPLLPATLLALDEPNLAAWLPAIASLSMFPLLAKDELRLAYIALLTLWLALAWPSSFSSTGSGSTESGSKGSGSIGDGSGDSGITGGSGGDGGSTGSGGGDGGERGGEGKRPAAAAWAAAAWASVTAGAAIHTAQLLVAPPARLPFLYDAAYSALGFANFAAIALYCNLRQWGCWQRPAAAASAQKKAQ